MNAMATHRTTAAAASTQQRTQRFWRSQREVILDLLRSAAQRDAWLTLDEMARETRFPPASISAQLRHLRKPQYGSWTIKRRQREWTTRFQIVWEYQIGS